MTHSSGEDADFPALVLPNGDTEQAVDTRSSEVQGKGLPTRTKRREGAWYRTIARLRGLPASSVHVGM